MKNNNCYENLNITNYINFINSIISTRGQWADEVRNSNRGCERHHIKLKCKGGEPKSLNWRHHDNIIWLYPSEHFIAHKILAEDNTDYSVKKAFCMMAFPKGKTKRTHELSPIEYEKAINAIRCEMPIDVKTKISESKKGHSVSNETKLKISKSEKGKIIPTDVRKKMSESKTGTKNSFYGRHHSKETREKQRQQKLGKKGNNRKKIMCIETGCIYDSISDACKSIKCSSIKYVLNGSRKTAGGYSWKYI